ncbi:MAG: aminotransferase class I/II-fold pyridoxal phosphate-dependent enzyme, partial [Gammaproteobacteria bacterium]|nr:aminotransferase class I/II-fold pyridoxal phosphate-dependent enzyme [Gammaproteobacteria bacterium]
AKLLRELRGDDAFGFLEHQHGMFSLLGASGAAVERLRDEHHVYMTADGRMNLAGVTPDNAEYLARSIVAVMR